MKVIFDTNVLLWALEGRLDEETQATLKSTARAIFVSAASAWEIEIKRALGKLTAPADIARHCDSSGFERLQINFAHATEAGRLPLHHGDPFDRMLVAQARIEGLTLATADEALARYDVPIMQIARG